MNLPTTCHSAPHLDEHTPLLNTNRENNDQALPAISPALARVSVSTEHEIPTDDILPYPLSDQSIAVAFTLAVLLQLRHVRIQSLNSVGAYDRWFRKNIDGVETLESQIIRVWTQYLDQYRDVREVETVLWTRFPLELEELKTVRVADFLGSFPALASHPIVALSLSHTWNHGIPTRFSSALPSAANSSVVTWTRRYDALCTPRVCHSIELVCHIAYLVLLVYFLLKPSNRPHTWSWNDHYKSLGWRELLLIFIPLSFVHGLYPLSNAIPLLVPFAFLISFPSAPSPGSGAFTIILWAFVLHTLRLLLPYPPSPLFLLSHQHTLPLGSFLSHGLSRTITTSVLFFFPLLLVASFLISFSMADILLKTFALLVDISLPSPMETRIAFLYLFAVTLVLLLSSIFLLGATLVSVSQENMDSWDRYSREVGHMARMAFVDAIALYAGLYRFPPPFNVVYLLIRIPHFGAHLLGIEVAWGAVVEQALWRVIVGPFVIIFIVLSLQWIA